MDHRTELRTAVELARLGNARRTAEALGVSQSTVTEAIGRLERAYGTRLFDRDRLGSRPTATGSTFIEAARRSLEILDNAEREVGLLERSERGSLSIAAHPCLIDTHLLPAIAAVLRDRSHLQCRIQTDTPEGLLDALRERRLELFVGLPPDGPCDDVETETIGTYRPVPFCRAAHPLTAVPAQGIKVLRDHPLVTTDAPTWQAERMQAALPTDPALVDDIAERGRRVHVTHIAEMVSLVTASDAIGYAPEAAIRTHVDDGHLVVLEVPDEQRALLQAVPIVIATMRARPLPPVAAAVIDALRRTAVA